MSPPNSEQSNCLPVVCPRCGAAPDAPCVNVTRSYMRGRPIARPHQGRIEKARMRRRLEGSSNSDPDYGLVAFKMTEDAAIRLNEALRYAESVVHNIATSNGAPDTRQKIENHGQWLRWAMRQIDAARSSS